MVGDPAEAVRGDKKDQAAGACNEYLLCTRSGWNRDTEQAALPGVNRGSSYASGCQLHGGAVAAEEGPPDRAPVTPGSQARRTWRAWAGMNEALRSIRGHGVGGGGKSSLTRPAGAGPAGGDQCRHTCRRVRTGMTQHNPPFPRRHLLENRHRDAPLSHLTQSSHSLQAWRGLRA